MIEAAWGIVKRSVQKFTLLPQLNARQKTSPPWHVPIRCTANAPALPGDTMESGAGLKEGAGWLREKPAFGFFMKALWEITFLAPGLEILSPVPCLLHCHQAENRQKSTPLRRALACNGHRTLNPNSICLFGAGKPCKSGIPLLQGCFSDENGRYSGDYSFPVLRVGGNRRSWK